MASVCTVTVLLLLVFNAAFTATATYCGDSNCRFELLRELKQLSDKQLEIQLGLCRLYAALTEPGDEGSLPDVCVKNCTRVEDPNKYACPRIISLKEWTTRNDATSDPRELPVPYVVIHHTATGACMEMGPCRQLVRDIQNYHMDHNTWKNIGYNFLIGGEGTIFEGRGWKGIGAHAYGYNTNGVGIALIGTFTDVAPPAVQLEAAKKLIACGVKNRFISSTYKLIGHKQVFNTECPGNKLEAILYRLMV